MTTIETSTLPITSTPALAAALRTLDQVQFAARHPWLQACDPLVPMYQVRNGTLVEETEAVVYVVSAVAERLRRLAPAYGEWEHFDAPAYFDLSRQQASELVKVVERVSTVHVTFFIDQLLPAFRSATGFWAETFAPAYAQMGQEALHTELFYRQVQPAMTEYWQQLTEIILQARTVLAGDVGFLATNGAQEERDRWRHWWTRPPVAGLDTLLTPKLVAIPTLTLTLDFALPAHRQPGRLRRLRLKRDRGQMRRRLVKG